MCLFFLDDISAPQAAYNALFPEGSVPVTLRHLGLLSPREKNVLAFAAALSHTDMSHLPASSVKDMIEQLDDAQNLPDPFLEPFVELRLRAAHLGLRSVRRVTLSSVRLHRHTLAYARAVLAQDATQPLAAEGVSLSAAEFAALIRDERASTLSPFLAAIAANRTSLYKYFDVAIEAGRKDLALIVAVGIEPPNDYTLINNELARALWDMRNLCVDQAQAIARALQNSPIPAMVAINLAHRLHTLRDRALPIALLSAPKTRLHDIFGIALAFFDQGDVLSPAVTSALTPSALLAALEAAVRRSRVYRSHYIGTERHYAVRDALLAMGATYLEALAHAVSINDGHVAAALYAQYATEDTPLPAPLDGQEDYGTRRALEEEFGLVVGETEGRQSIPLYLRFQVRYGRAAYAIRGLYTYAHEDPFADYSI